MKKTVSILFLFLLAAAVMAQQQGMTDQPQPTPTTTEQPIGAQIRDQIQARNFSHLQEMAVEQSQELMQQAQQMREQSREVYQNQNRVRLAVHNLLAMGNLTKGIGSQISAIAREFNNSVQATLRAEQRIQNRSQIARFFAGGNQEAAGEIEQKVEQNRQRVQELQQLYQQCMAEEEVCQFLQEQIQNIQQEQERLQELAQREMQSKGLFGWLWK